MPQEQNYVCRSIARLLWRQTGQDSNDDAGQKQRSVG